jgi:hypothetical protein
MRRRQARPKGSRRYCQQWWSPAAVIVPETQGGRYVFRRRSVGRRRVSGSPRRRSSFRSASVIGHSSLQASQYQVNNTDVPLIVCSGFVRPAVPQNRHRTGTRNAKRSYGTCSVPPSSCGVRMVSSALRPGVSLALSPGASNDEERRRSGQNGRWRSCRSTHARKRSALRITASISSTDRALASSASMPGDGANSRPVCTSTMLHAICRPKTPSFSQLA